MVDKKDKMVAKLAKKLGRDPTNDELAAYLKKKGVADVATEKRKAKDDAPEERAAKKSKKEKKKDEKEAVEEKKSKKSKKETKEEGKRSKKEKKSADDVAEKKSKKSKKSTDEESEAEEMEKKDKKSKKEKKEEKKAKKEKKSKKAKKEEPVAKVVSESSSEEEEEVETEEEKATNGVMEVEVKVSAKNGLTAVANPEGYTRVFAGNLAYTIDDDTLKEFLKDCGEVQDIHWLSDKETGRFYGTGFVEFGDPDAAARAVALNGETLLGRPIKIEFTTSRGAGAGKATDNRKGPAGKGAVDKAGYGPRSEKQEGCTTVFLANLSYSIEEQHVYDFFSECGEIARIRWLEDKNTGEFKGCGFVEFTDGSAVDLAIAKAGEALAGRPVRIDYA